MSAVPESFEHHRLRPMAYADLDEIMEVELRAYPFPWTEGIFRDCLRVGYGCWVLEDTGRECIDAYGVMSLAAGEAHVLNLCVRPESQGHGLGRALLQGLVDKARQFKVESVFLEVRPSNVPAVKLYRSEGFAEIGLRKDYYPASGGREDAVVLVKRL